jgi:ABC-type methionine transport system ATPase subunit
MNQLHETASEVGNSHENKWCKDGISLILNNFNLIESRNSRTNMPNALEIKAITQ